VGGTMANHRSWRSRLIVPAIFSELLRSACASAQGYGSAASSYGSAPAAPSLAPAARPRTTPQAAPASPAAAPMPPPSPEQQLVRLERPAPKSLTLKVRNSYNLSASKRGEPYVARFYEIVTFRRKRLGELIPAASTPLALVSAIPGQTPGAAVGSSEQAVVAIVALNKTKKPVDVKGS